jgi:hypothetical protein
MRTPAQFQALKHTKAAALERRLDQAIDMAALHGDVAVNIGMAGIDRDVALLVVADYRRAGWDAEIVSDQRDGDFIRLALP